jgi:hypothetical protein
MRKITTQACQALLNGETINLSNTRVTRTLHSGSMYLHGHEIAKIVNNNLFINLQGYTTNTTLERLNGLPNVQLHRRAGVVYLNNKPISTTAWHNVTVGSKTRGYTLIHYGTNGIITTRVLADSQTIANDELKDMATNLNIQPVIACPDNLVTARLYNLNLEVVQLAITILECASLAEHIKLLEFEGFRSRFACLAWSDKTPIVVEWRDGVLTLR